MRAKLLLAVLALAVAASAATACKQKNAAPAMGKETTSVDTTKKQ